MKIHFKAMSLRHGASSAVLRKMSYWKTVRSRSRLGGWNTSQHGEADWGRSEKR